MCVPHTYKIMTKIMGHFNLRPFLPWKQGCFFKAHSSPSYCGLNILTWKCRSHILFNSHGSFPSDMAKQRVCACPQPVRWQCQRLRVRSEICTGSCAGKAINRWTASRALAEGHIGVSPETLPTQLRGWQAGVTVLMALDRKEELLFFGLNSCKIVFLIRNRVECVIWQCLG